MSGAESFKNCYYMWLIRMGDLTMSGRLANFFCSAMPISYVLIHDMRGTALQANSMYLDTQVRKLELLLKLKQRVH